MMRHVIARFADHEEAEKAVYALADDFGGRISISSREPRENWWQHERWLDVSLEALGGLAATVSQIVPGFGVLFMGGTLDGVRQGEVLADWLQAHPQPPDGGRGAFVIVSANEDERKKAELLLAKYGGQNIHTTR